MTVEVLAWVPGAGADLPTARRARPGVQHVAGVEPDGLSRRLARAREAVPRARRIPGADRGGAGTLPAMARPHRPGARGAATYSYLMIDARDGHRPQPAGLHPGPGAAWFRCGRGLAARAARQGFHRPTVAKTAGHRRRGTGRQGGAALRAGGAVQTALRPRSIGTSTTSMAIRSSRRIAADG